MSYPAIQTAHSISMSYVSSKRSSVITMKAPEALLSTQTLPSVCEFLKTHLPSIFTSSCYNPQNLCFSDEVKKTEIAHLFEHIVLEYLVLSNINERKKRVFEGVTMWDWRKEEKGTFRIRINIGKKESFQLAIAMDKANKLLTKLITKHKTQLN